ncbi:MAG TPA: DUF1565 domain-containing protein [Stenomitos sp.]
MNQPLRRSSRRNSLLSLQRCSHLSAALLLLMLGVAAQPAHAQQTEASVQASAAAEPLAKPQLFVNPSTGKDEPSAGKNESAPFRTITYALQQAKPGTIVQLVPGSYSKETGETFPLTIPQGVTLQGNEFNQGSNTFITGGDFISSSWWGSQNVAVLMKPDAQVIGITITNLNSRGTGVWIESSNATVRGCTFTKSAREGVFVAGKANPTVENNAFVENSANGIAITGLSTGMVRNNTFQRTGFGIAVSEKAQPQLVNNRIQDNVDGIVVSHTAMPQLRGNLVEGNKRDGLVAISNAKPDLGTNLNPGRNIFRNNGRYAVYNATLSGALAVEGNDVAGTVQLAAIGPTGVDQNTPPGLQPAVAQPSAMATMPGNMGSIAAAPLTPSANVPAIAIPAAAPAKPKVDTVSKSTSLPKQPVKVALDSTILKQELAKAPTVQYKGKTYVLLDTLLKLAQ